MRARTSSAVSPAAVGKGAWRWCASVETANHHQRPRGLAAEPSAEQVKVRPSWSKLNASVGVLMSASRLVSERDAPAAQVVRRHRDAHAVAVEHADAEAA